jgi:Flp pilus assembly protein CpaB
VKNKRLMIVAVALGVLVVLLINARFSKLEKAANPEKTTLYRASVEIAPGMRLQEAFEKRLLRATELPKKEADNYADAVDRVEFDAWKGEVIARTVRANEFVRVTDLRPYTPREMSSRLRKGDIAIALAVGPENAVGYLVAPGDRVDVYMVRMVRDAAAPGGTRAESRLVRENLEVFAVDQMVVPGDGQRTPVRWRGASYRTVTLAGRPKDIEEVIRARAEGALTLALRPAEGE